MISRKLAAVKIVRSIFLFAFLLALSLGCSPEARADDRVALIVGNATYRNAPTLRNSRNDADDISEQLRRLGFTVVDGRDLDGRGMRAALAQFAKRLKGTEAAALFYYSGHGLQIDGQNYLVPIDAPIDDGTMMPFDLVKLDDVIEALSYTTGVRLLILDACRGNPFANALAQRSGTRGGELTRGLARIQQTQGMLIAYATQSNMVAADGTGRNSPFTRALLRELQVPGLEVGALFRHVTGDVHEDTKGQQTPEVSVSLLGDFYLNPHESDIDAWKRVGQSTDVEALKEFIATFPTSDFADAAHDRIHALESEKERDRLIQKYTEQERQLRVEKEQAEADLRKAIEELNEARKGDEHKAVEQVHVIPKDQPSAPNPPPAAGRMEPDGPAKKLADQEASKIKQLEADKAKQLEADKARQLEADKTKQLEEKRAELEKKQAKLEDERVSVQQTLEKLLKLRFDREQADRRVATDNILRSPASETPSDPARQRPSCKELNARAQLGDITEADRSALRGCRR